MDQRMGGNDYSLDEEIKSEEKQTRIEFLPSGEDSQEDTEEQAPPEAQLW